MKQIRFPSLRESKSKLPSPQVMLCALFQSSIKHPGKMKKKIRLKSLRGSNPFLFFLAPHSSVTRRYYEGCQTESSLPECLSKERNSLQQSKTLEISSLSPRTE